ncbi:MAG TPA: alanine--glyoxylate aminotransferase family protein, partial [Candidatus Avamphibacillus intestinigallinarum]|nr:alanine--glyoxylate aminotransferase family protein [Candidatus Avamphibacillus intestinigallinarum]
PGSLKNTCFRIGHMGYCYPSDVLQYLSLIELGMYQNGLSIELGSGVQAAQQLFIDRKVGK